MITGPSEVAGGGDALALCLGHLPGIPQAVVKDPGGPGPSLDILVVDPEAAGVESGEPPRCGEHDDREHDGRHAKSPFPAQSGLCAGRRCEPRPELYGNRSHNLTWLSRTGYVTHDEQHGPFDACAAGRGDRHRVLLHARFRLPLQLLITE
jgi:hypothetical protein